MIGASVHGLINNQSLVSVLLKILINHLHIIFIITQFDLGFPSDINRFFRVQQVISNLPTILFESDCFFQLFSVITQVYFLQLLKAAFTPILVAMMVPIGWRIKFYFDGDPTLMLQRCIYSLIVISFLFQPYLLIKFFDSGNCVNIGTEKRLLNQTEVLCYEGAHLGWFILISIPCVIIWGIGLPVVY